MNFRILIVLLFVLGTINSYSQDFSASINKEPLHWNQWEVSMGAEEKLELIKSLDKIMGIEVALTYYSYTIENIINNFHIIDFDNDGQNDVIYEGFVGGRNNGVILFKIENGVCNKPIKFLGDLISIWRSDVWAPISFKINNYRCCSGYVDYIETYTPQYDRNGDLEYEMSAKIAFAHGTVFPDEFKHPRVFRVVNEESVLAIAPINNDKEYDYHLKKTPVVDNFPYKEVYFKFDGNIIANFPIGTSGLALFETMDSSGQTWIFVMINSKSKPTMSLFCYAGDNNNHPYKTLGWMKKPDLKFLTSEEINKAPISILD